MAQGKKHPFELEQEPEAPSRSQLKRDSAALQKTGEELAALSPGLWDKFSISKDMRQALNELLRVRGHEAKRRQLQYIGRLMRNENTDQIEHELAELKTGHEHQTMEFHALEGLRDRIIESDPNAWGEVNKLLEGMGEEEKKEWTKKIETYAKAVRDKNDKKAFRFLFRTLKEIQANSDG